MARTDIFEIGSIHCQGIPTSELNDTDKGYIQDLRVTGYVAALPEIDPNIIDQYVYDSMDTWVNANKGVGKKLRPNQVFGNTVVWLAYGENGNPNAEVLSADNASAGSGIMGQVMRAAKMHIPVLPTVKNNRPHLRHGPYRAVREMLGSRTAVETLLYMTAAYETRSDQPMTAYTFEGDGFSELLEGWGFNQVDAESGHPLGPESPEIVTQTLRARSGKVVAKSILGGSASIATHLSRAGALKHSVS